MKFFRKGIAFVLSLALSVTLFAGVTFAASAPAVTAKLTETNATVHGRFTKEKHAGVDTLTFSHGAAGFGVNFTGSEFWINVPEVPTENGGVRKVEVSVRVDSDYAMDAKMVTIDRTGWLCVASGLSSGSHHIEIRKKSRGFFGLMQSDWFAVSEIGVASGKEILTADKLSDLVIEIYGDSISNGDAIWPDGSAYTNGNWTGVIERLLDAEVRVTGNTGNGLCGWVMATGGNGEVENLLPPQENWDKIDPNHGGGTWSHAGANAADVVIINLGTNDRVELGGGDLTDTAFENEYIRFIKQIKKDCPDAIVICTIGAMGLLKGKNYEVDFDRILDECNARADKPFCYFVELQKCDTMTGGAGYDGGHPSNLAGEVYGLQFATLINKVLKLGKTLPTDVPASAYEKRLGTTAPTGSIINTITKKTTSLSYIDDVIKRGQKEVERIYDPEVVPSVGPNLALSGTIIVDSVHATYGGVAENANDGDKTTRWQSNAAGNGGDEGWIGCKWDTPQTIRNIVIDWETAHPAADGFRVEISDNGTAWKEVPFVSERTGLDNNDHQVDTISLYQNTSTKYIRVVCFKAFNGKANPSAYEFEVYTAAEKKPAAGDANGDGEIDADDLTALARHVGKIETITNAATLAACDLDGKEGVTADDLTKLARIIAKID